MSTLDLSEYVRVTNKTGSTIKSRYDGKDYIFRDGDATDIHELAAAHIFGWGADNKTNAFHRLGWLAEMGYEMALERLNDIEFGEVPSPAVAIGGNKQRQKRISSPTPLADAGAEAGEGNTSPTEARGGAQGDL